MSGSVVFLTLGLLVILAVYSLIDKWMDVKSLFIEQEAERMRVETETAELEMEIRRDAYYGKTTNVE